MKPFVFVKNGVVISKWNNYTEEVSFSELVYIFIESLRFVVTVCSIQTATEIE